MTLHRVLAVLLLGATLIAPVARSEVPPGWIVAGDRPKDFEYSVDSHETYQQHPSALIAARPGVVSSGFGTLMQSIDAENYHGSRVSLSGYLKTQDAGRAQLWMRVNGADRRVLAFDNMDDRPVVATTAWTRYQIVLDVPPDSRDISFGFLLLQKGKVWGGNFELQKVAATVPVTSATPVSLPKEPANLDFSGAAYKPETVHVSDLYREERETGPERARIEATGVGGGEFYRADKYNLCGMRFVGIASHEHPGLRWDLKVSVFVREGARAAGIAAGTFTLPPNTRMPVPRPAISRLEIKLPGESAAVAANLSTQNADNGVAGVFPAAYAEKLFDALDAGTPFTLNLTLNSGKSESVLIQTLAGKVDPYSVYRGSGAPMRRCLGSLVPATDSGLRHKLIELEHPW